MITTAHHLIPTPKARDPTGRHKDSMDRRKDSMDRRRDNTDSRDTDRRSKACTTSKARRRRGAIMTTRGGRALRRLVGRVRMLLLLGLLVLSREFIVRNVVRTGATKTHRSRWVASIFACWMGWVIEGRNDIMVLFTDI
jgi:microsomal dipeptidase-like Zn-dependent dipeptidase